MKTFNPAGLIRENILRLRPYASARSEFDGEARVMLDANENASGGPYCRYPDPMQSLLKAKIAGLKRVTESCIFLGNGSDEAIDLLIRITCRPGTEDHILICPPTYGMYEVSAQTNDVTVVEVPLKADFGLPVDAVLTQLDAATKIIFLCSPNNPSGNLMPYADIEAILQSAPGLVVIDEAYIDFCEAPSWLERLPEFPNLVVLQTLSKARGMAGLRIGMAFAAPGLIGILNRVKPPYNIGSASQELGLRILSDEEAFAAARRDVLQQRGALIAALAQLAVVKRVYPSDANFLLIKVQDANRLYAHLLSCGIVVRNRHTMPGCANCLRVTVGSAMENAQLLAALKNARLS